VVLGVQPVDEPNERLLGGDEPLALHRAAAVEHDLNCGGRPRALTGRRGCGELEHHRDLVVLLYGHNLDIHQRMHLHRCLLGSSFPDQSPAADGT